jgi:hypothetical protein
VQYAWPVGKPLVDNLGKAARALGHKVKIELAPA